MGIDIYTRWNGITPQEAEQQCTGFSVVHGHIGYLREAYHGGPYATHYLVAEAFASPDCEAEIPAAVLRQRLPKTIELAMERQREVYHDAVTENDPVVQSFVKFVELCESKEAATGQPCTIIASY